jgi:hypothetical protein
MDGVHFSPALYETPMNNNTLLLVGVALVCGVALGVYLTKQEPAPVWLRLTEAVVLGTASGVASALTAHALRHTASPCV